MKATLFPAKLLLFGEYGIINNSYGLSIPYPYYYGELKLDKQNYMFEFSNKILKKYFVYFYNTILKKKLEKYFLFDNLYRDIENGLYFDSNIPYGYGLGSSAALVAAICDKYFSKYIIFNIYFLKNIFSIMESYFHGCSSGIDPLVSYLRKPLLIKSYFNITPVNIPRSNCYNFDVFIINSHFSVKTSDMVNIFFQKYDDYNFKKKFFNQFLIYNKQAISFFLKKNFLYLFKYIKYISIWEYKYLKQMIPVKLLKLWKYGFISDKYYLKLCGSGGGGYILGFTLDYDFIHDLIGNNSIVKIFI